jgi:hypothetical protein
MTGRIESSEVLELLQRHHIGKRRAAELCAINYRTFKRWMTGRPSMPQSAWELLQIRIAELSAAPTDIAEQKSDLTVAASIMGQKGGMSRSEAKIAAVRENGKKGGRPKKSEKSEEK